MTSILICKHDTVTAFYRNGIELVVLDHASMSLKITAKKKEYIKEAGELLEEAAALMEIAATRKMPEDQPLSSKP